MFAFFHTAEHFEHSDLVEVNFSHLNVKNTDIFFTCHKALPPRKEQKTILSRL